MVRLVEEAIEVRVADQEEAGSGSAGTGAVPEQFLWRGRLYRVTEVVDHWQERRSWWRSHGELPLSQVPLAREVWRVAASRGRSSAPGVYDLGADGVGGAGTPAWLLLRTQD